MVSVEEITIGLLDVAASGVGFFFPNPGVEKDECDGVLCTVGGYMGTRRVHMKEHVYLVLSELQVVLGSRALSPLETWALRTD